MPRQIQPVITPEDVAALFREAKVPEPPTEKLQYFAVAVTNIAVHYRPKSREKRRPQHRAQAAVDELRRVLPGIIENEHAELMKMKKIHQG